MSAPEAGWYVNPSGPGRRYWDGHRWTEHIDDSAPTAAQYTSPSASAPPPPAFNDGPPGGHAPNPYAAPPPPPPGGYANPGYVQPAQGVGGLVVVGYITAVVMPIVGFILGIVAATRRYEPLTARHGVWVIAVSVIAFFVWLAILNSQGSYSY